MLLTEALREAGIGGVVQWGNSITYLTVDVFNIIRFAHCEPSGWRAGATTPDLTLYALESDQWTLIHYGPGVRDAKVAELRRRAKWQRDQDVREKSMGGEGFGMVRIKTAEALEAEAARLEEGE